MSEWDQFPAVGAATKVSPSSSGWDAFPVAGGKPYDFGQSGNPYAPQVGPRWAPSPERIQAEELAARAQLASPYPFADAVFKKAAATIAAPTGAALRAVTLNAAGGTVDQLNRDAQLAYQLGSESATRSSVPGAGVLSSAAGTLLGVVPTVALTGPTGAAFTFGAGRGSEALTEGKDAGLSASETTKYAAKAAAIETGTTLLFNALGKYIPGLGGLEQAKVAKTSLAQAVKRAAAGLTGETAEESAIAIADAFNKRAAGVDKEAVQNLPETLKETALVTLATMGLANTPSLILSAPGAFAKRQPEKAATIAAIENPTRGELEKAGIELRGEPTTAESRKQLVDAVKAEVEKAAIPVQGEPIPPRPSDVGPTIADAPKPAIIDDRLRKLYRETSGHEIGELVAPDQGHAEAVAFMKARGKSLQFFRSPSGADANSFYDRNGKTVYLNADRPAESLWYTIGHEYAHASGADQRLADLPQEIIQQAMTEYAANAAPAYLKKLQKNPKLWRQEGVARYMGKLLADADFRAKVRNDNPSLWQKIVEGIKRIVGKFRTPELQRVLDEFNALPQTSPEVSPDASPTLPNAPQASPATPRESANTMYADMANPLKGTPGGDALQQTREDMGVNIKPKWTRSEVTAAAAKSVDTDAAKVRQRLAAVASEGQNWTHEQFAEANVLMARQAEAAQTPEQFAEADRFRRLYTQQRSQAGSALRVGQEDLFQTPEGRKALMWEELLKDSADDLRRIERAKKFFREQGGDPGLLLEDVEQKQLPKMEDNYRKPLSHYASKLYREVSLERLIPFIDINTSTDMTFDDVFFANTRDLALGQGKNQGAMIEFTPDKIEGLVNTAKPSWQFAYDNGDAELIGRGNSQKTYREAVKSVTIRKDATAGKPDQMRLRLVLKRLQDQGWTKQQNDDGSVTYSRPDDSDNGIRLADAFDKTIAKNTPEEKSAVKAAMRDDNSARAVAALMRVEQDIAAKKIAFRKRMEDKGVIPSTPQAMAALVADQDAFLRTLREVRAWKNLGRGFGSSLTGGRIGAKGLADALYEASMANILSGFRTITTNVVGTPLNYLGHLLPRAAVAVGNKLTGSKSGPQLAEFGYMRQAMGGAVKEAWSNAKKSLWHETSMLDRQSGRQGTQLESVGGDYAIPGWLGRVLRAPGYGGNRFGDDLGRTFIAHAEAMARAYRLAVESNVPKNQIDAFVKKHYGDTNSIVWQGDIEGAYEYANKMAFQEKGGETRQNFVNWLSMGRNSVPGLRWFLRFVKFPVNAAVQTKEWTPFHFWHVLATGAENLQNGRPWLYGVKEDAAKAMIGTLAATLLFDRFEGDDEERRDWFGLTRKGPRFGDKVVDMSRVEPFGSVYSVLADTVISIRKNGLSSTPAAAIASLGDTLINKPTMRSVKSILDFGNAFKEARESNDPSILEEGLKVLASEQATSFFPRIVMQFGEASGDQPGYEKRRQQAAELFGMEMVRAAAQWDAWGRKKSLASFENPTLDYGWRLLTPIGITDQTQHPGDVMIARFVQGGGQFKIPELSNRYGDGKKMNPDQFQRYVELSGKISDTLFNAAGLNITDPKQSDMDALSAIFTSARDKAREIVRREIVTGQRQQIDPASLAPEIRSARIRSLRTSLERSMERRKKGETDQEFALRREEYLANNRAKREELKRWLKPLTNSTAE